MTPNERLLGLDGDVVSFRYKDYRHGGRWRIERVHALEFIRRFLLHVLPRGFVRIRYCGLLGNRYRERNLMLCRALLQVDAPEPAPGDESRTELCLRVLGIDLTLCEVCGSGHWIHRDSTPRPAITALALGRAPP